MDKSPEAFRTISEVATLLETPAHVLRFWETRFPQIRPVKRAGGRRYYRPNDVALITGIKYLLHAEGMTIRGVQKVLRDQGVRHVAGLIGQDIADLDADAEAALSAALTANFFHENADDTPPAERAASATIVALETALRRPAAPLSGHLSATGDNDDATIVEGVDFARNLDKDMDETPVFPGFDLGPSLAPPAFTTLGEAYMAMRALPRGAMAQNPAAAQWLARARALHARMTLDNAHQGAL